MKEIVFHNITLEDMLAEGWTRRFMKSGYGRLYAHTHPFLNFAATRVGLCRNCKSLMKCEAIAKVQSAASFFPIFVTVTACQLFEPEDDGKVIISEK